MNKLIFTALMVFVSTALFAQDNKLQETEKPSLGSKLLIENLTGAVTKNEISAFKMHIYYFDVVLANIQNGHFAGNIDDTTGKGQAAGHNYVRDEYIYLAAIRPEKYEPLVLLSNRQEKWQLRHKLQPDYCG